MKIVAIIAEYNPFHNGHLYQIQKLKKDNYTVIVIMSSSFTQRGIPAISSKFSRAKVALNYGADLVLELPVVFSTSNAEIFSKGAIKILDSLSCVDYLCFGAENNLDELIKVNKKINENLKISENNIKKYLDEGFSYLKAKELSYSFLSKEEINIIKKPNNILGLEYLKALNAINSNIKPFVILRKNTNHNSTFIFKNFASASLIRNYIYKENINLTKNFMPELSFNSIKDNNNLFLDLFFDLFKYLILSGKVKYSDYIDYEQGLENRFLNFIKEDDIFEFINKVSSKRYTKSRISRLIMQIILDLKKEFIFKSLEVEYIRVLGAKQDGLRILKHLKSNKIEFIEKFSKIKEISDEDILKQICLKEVFATNLYNLYSKGVINEDYLKSPIIIK
ncbi:MAG: tRNA(Met) cytidine acetate ligase [Peptoniphilaceae bacterium]